MLPTLKGIFPEPKSQPKRNFLRENKMHLKDLQRSSSRQQLLKAEEERKLIELQKRQRHKSLDKTALMTQGRPISRSSCSCQSVGRPASSCNSVVPPVVSAKTNTSTREVQTDDIVDEDFLYEALKRCSSVEVNRERARHEMNDFPETNPQPDTCAVETSSRCGLEDDPQPLDFQNLHIDCANPPATARSSTQLTSRRTGRRLYEVGVRQDVPLPKYLERERYEKEQQRQRDLQQDSNCPPGYAPVSETERKSTLELAQKKFQDLVDELNRMPMTTQTLRMRNRKAEIERILTELEAEIRIFSKPKVYVKAECL